MGVADHSADLVLSIFGAMFASDPLAVARELVRVTRRGGRIVMGNWISDDPSFISQVLKISARYAPPPPEGFISPLAWGSEINVRGRFAAAGVLPEQIRCSRETYLFRAPMEPTALIEVLRKFYGPAMNAFEAATKAGTQDVLQRELEALASAHNTSARAHTTVIPATFLKVIVNL
ncbi:class I SAM-dependent methyltransferase [Comamonas endophytica]|uniref:class I SAM-dependent methyltransferase n=1 Tax=Comamonas endophytica TaxID=2949090 RepID=UPI0036717EDB